MKYYRLEDDEGYGVFNEKNTFYDIMNSFTEEEIHSRTGIFSMLPKEVKKSMSKEELLSHHCCYKTVAELSQLNSAGYNIIELEILKWLAPKPGSAIYLFKKTDIITSKIIGKN